jgi:hypothetical protein
MHAEFKYFLVPSGQTPPASIHRSRIAGFSQIALIEDKLLAISVLLHGTRIEMPSLRRLKYSVLD